MGILDRIRESRRESTTQKLVENLQEQLTQGDLTVDFLSEQIAELELALEDQGWIQLGVEGTLDFSLPGLQKIIRMSRVMTLKNPLIGHGVKVQADYVFGQGVQIKASDPRVDEVVQAFLQDPKNKKVLTQHQAMWERERDLQIEGNLFFALFVNSSTGEAKVRFLPVTEIADIIADPEDADSPWWYKRVWNERRFDPATGEHKIENQTRYYRDWQIPTKPASRTKMGESRVEKDVWVYHLKVGALRGMKFGVPETYSSLDWARGYKDYLSNWASLAKALARFAYKLTGKTKQLRKAKQKLDTTVGTDAGVETNPPPGTASTAHVPPGMDLAAIPKTGAQISADDGIQLRKMAAAGMGIPDNIMANDPQQGTLATARTLDRPTELSMRSRQMLWADVFRDVLGFAVEKAITRPNGRLAEVAKKAEKAKEADGEDAPRPLNAAIEVSFPPVLERDLRESVRAIVDAATMGGRPAAGTLPANLVTRLLMIALAVENIDTELEGFTPGAVPTPAPSVKKAVKEAIEELRQELIEAANT